MSLGTSIASSRSGLLNSLASGIRNHGIEVSSNGLPERPTSFAPLFDFIRVASEAGLQQYPQDIAEEGLLAARLGEGLDYAVDKAKDLEGRVVVVKHVKATIDSPGDDDNSRIRKVLHEIKIATHPALKRHTNILQMKGFGWELVEDGQVIPFLVVEYAEHGTLRNYLQSSGCSVSAETKSNLALDAARGLQVLHNLRIAHGDIKLENALVVSSNPLRPTLKITDFGLSVVLREDETLYEYWGTPYYRPPEVYQQTGDSEAAGLIHGLNYLACDIYPYGLLILELLLDGEVYTSRGINQDHLDNPDLALQYLLQVDDTEHTVLPLLKGIVKSCLFAEPGQRPRIENIILQLEAVRSLREVQVEEEPNPLAFSNTPIDNTNDVDVDNINQLLGILVGRQLDDGSIHFAPWKIQESIAEGLRQRTNHCKFELASRACLKLGICHYLGYGVERDRKSVLWYMDQAAAKGSFEARRIRHRIYEAFSQPMEPLDLLVKLDDQEERQLQRILVAECGNQEVNPFRVFDAVVQEDFCARDNLTLHQAAYSGNVARLQELLSHTDDFQDERGRSAQFLAAQGGHLDAMETLLRFGRSNPSLANEDGHTVLHMLVMLSHEEVEIALSTILQLSPGLELDVFSWSLLDAQEHWGELWGAPLHWAVLAGNKAMTSCLVAAGARVYGWPQDSCPVRIAVSLHLSDILEILLSAVPLGASLKGENLLYALNSGNPFRRLLLHGKDYIAEIEKIVSLLMRLQPTVDEEESPNDSPLHRILLTNFSESDQHIARALATSSKDKYQSRGWTSLQAAIAGCHGSPLPSNCRMALDIIDTQVDLRRRSTFYKPGWMALHWSAAGGILPVARMLLQLDPNSINLYTQEEEERTPLHLAAADGKSVEMINLLLEHGANGSLETSYLKLTPLGSFISNQRGELDIDILKSLLQASKDNAYLVFGSHNWNILHYAAVRAAILDVESLSGHVLLRTLATFPEMKSLVESVTAQGWTPLHLASYFVDYTAIKLLVESFNANIQVETPQGSSVFDIVMERGRQFPQNLRGADSCRKWSRLAYRSAMFLQSKLEAIEGPYHLTPLHLAAYMGYYDEVVRLVNEHPNMASETNQEGETPLEMLKNTMPTNIAVAWATRFCKIAKSILLILE